MQHGRRVGLLARLTKVLALAAANQAATVALAADVVPGPLTTPQLGPPAAAPERLTLDEAVRRALARNPSVAVALAEVDRANALVREARASWLPTLAANASYTRLDQARVLNGRTITDADSVAGNLTLTVPLVAPQAWAADRHARDLARVAGAGAVDVRRLVAFATAQAYIAVMAQHRQIRSTEAALTNAREHAEYAHTRLAGGVGRSIDDVRAQQDLATDEVEMQAVYTGLVRAREALGVLVGAAGPVDVVADVELGAMPSLDGALEDARTKRPDVVTQRARIAAAERLRRDVWAFYTPYLAAVGQPFLQVGNELQPRSGWQAQLVLTLPLYDGGLRYGAAQERDAALAQARAGLDATLRQAQSEVRVAFEAMLRADQALVAARQAGQLARRAYDLAIVAYKAGATSNLDVIDAARRSRDADGDVTQAEDVARRARLDLLVASGRMP
jgi:outer membrane protein TolC